MRGLKTTLLGRPEEFESRTRFSDSMGGLGAYRTIQFFLSSKILFFQKSVAGKIELRILIFALSAEFGMMNPQTRKWKIENSMWGCSSVG